MTQKLRDRFKALLHPSSLIALLLIGVFGIILLIWILPQRYINSLDIPDIKERVTLENASRGTLTQGLTGVMLFTTAFIAWRNLVATEEKQVTERFSKAVEQLGNENIHVRLGAIYALERISKDSDKDYWQIMEILTAYVREISPYPPRDKADKDKANNKPLWESVLSIHQKDNHPTTTDDQKDIPSTGTDIQAVLTVLSRRNSIYTQKEKYRLDLSNSNLREANFDDINLIRANLNGTYLREAFLNRAFLNHAQILCAHLNGARLHKAHLSEAYLTYAKLISADLTYADLRGADLTYADLRGANLTYADLRGANLSAANLTDANFFGAKNLTPEQVKKARNWNKAKYSEKFSKQLGLPPEPSK
ncbi:hypothetical protein F7734_33185 [Scytonema sp. UIC 10036]|uniref:pentapeptide repeat-containing protein n=1 Tax=Scytonema sp. UIC 10036 TaxID=2304196 RepID=UPI0012DAC4FF|nr:pentapeptide repeat-containing protein [Scytonema sp. UIC 10036]MUG96935.1 hypothetical protein [Scytonema sp. UIC 10036]